MSQTLVILAFLAFAALAAGFAYAWWQASQRLLDVSDGGKAAIEQHVAALMKAQGEITGHVQGLSNRIDGFGKHIGQSMTDTTKSTHESLAKLGERLAIIDKAQQTITTLSGQVVELQHVLANKQTRGAFGQGRMESIVRDGLPANAYEFQFTLSNGTRPDCVVRLPRAPLLVVDAKFPLEAWSALRAAATPEATKVAEAQFRRDALKHIQDIADRYFIAGETQDVAMMFIPSESIFADFHERFDDMVQKAARARVMIVSPSLLMLSLQLAMSMLRDQRMREQAHLIQQEVGKMMEDVTRLGERVKRLQTHFTQANGDIEDILKSTRGVFSHGTKIAQVEFTNEQEVVTRSKPTPKPPIPRGPELPFEDAAE